MIEHGAARYGFAARERHRSQDRITNERCVFGQYKLQGIVFGGALMWLSVAAVLKGWLMPWGLILWIPVFLLGLATFALIGHMLPILLLPFWGISELFRRKKKAKTTHDAYKASEDTPRKLDDPQR